MKKQPREKERKKERKKDRKKERKEGGKEGRKEMYFFIQRTLISSSLLSRWNVPCSAVLYFSRHHVAGE